MVTWRGGKDLIGHLVFFFSVLLCNHVTRAYFNLYGKYAGCADGTVEGLQGERHPKIAACTGRWEGHIENATSVCAQGWRVCGWYDEYLLKTITWKDATSLTGCYAMNAAQDGGMCKPCISELEQDDLAGVGRGCPHQSYGQKSCISGGQIDVSCCIDTHFDRACQYRPGLATGVLCCKLPGVPPQILVAPQKNTHVTSGTTFVLSCVALGTPTPKVTWYKKGIPLSQNVSRISVFDSGYLLISDSKPQDGGKYQCRVTNIAGEDTADAEIVVTDYESGCADGKTDALHNYEDIQGCQGAWEGHVKRGKALCARGWHVCNPRHTNLLKMLTWSEIEDTKGCYAYNAMNTFNGCQRCHTENMAGIGKHCGRLRRTAKSCLAQGRVDAYRSRSKGCEYVKGLTTGVLCCKKPQRQDWFPKPDTCSPKCHNGGLCVAPDRCKCKPGYKGAWCQNAICPAGCIANSLCIKPGVCRCKNGYTYTGNKCKKRDLICKRPCLNGGRCKHGKCKCPIKYTGNRCQQTQYGMDKADLNRTEK